MNVIRTISLLTNPAVPECGAAARELEATLTKQGFDVRVGDRSSAAADVDLIVVLGGDGYLMESIHALGFPSTNMFGVKFGTVGFLMNPPGCLGGLGEVISQRRFRSEVYPVLESTIRLRSGEEHAELAFNDIVLERVSGQTIRFATYVDGTLFNRFSGDGLVIATSGGSTAYSLAAGGPALHPDVAAIVMTPLYPHRATPFHSQQFSLVLPLSRTIRIDGEDVDKRPIRALADGRRFDEVASVEVCDSGQRINLLRVDDHSFVEAVSRTFIGDGE